MARPRLDFCLTDYDDHRVLLACWLAIPETPPDPQHEDVRRPTPRSNCRANRRTRLEEIGKRAADEGAGDADQQIGEEPVNARRRLLGDLAGDDADDQHAEETDSRHGQQSLRVVHRDLPSHQSARRS